MPAKLPVALAVSFALALGACSSDKPPPQPQASTAPVAAPLPPRPSDAERFASAVEKIGGTREGDTVKITLAGDRFAAGKSEFQAGDRIDAIATVLKEHPDARLKIEGYTDSRGSDALNQRLSAQRADAVKRALEERGIDGSRIDTAGRGEENAVASNDTADGRAQNRRVELTFVPESQDRLASAPSAAPSG